MKPRLKCDKCDWTLQTESAIEASTWLHKQCPQCNDSVIVNFDDLALLAMLQGFEDFGMVGEPGSMPGAETVRMIIDSGALRG